MAFDDSIRICEGVSELSDSYNGIILDQWGVIHDGHKPYDGVIEALTELKKRGRQIILLSNSGKRAEPNRERMSEMGFDPALFDHIVTSGEMTWNGLRMQTEGIFKGLGKKCLLFSRGGDKSVVEGLDIELVESAEDADFILISGTEAPQKTLADYEPQLRIGVKKGIKLLCANPDTKAIMGNKTMLGPGQIAKRYVDFGGVAHFIGKPYQPIFQYALSLFDGVLPSGVVVIGDSLSHDILGGMRSNFDTCLVGAGLHNSALKNMESPEAQMKALKILSNNFGVKPDYYMPEFRWGKALPDRKNKRRGE